MNRKTMDDLFSIGACESATDWAAKQTTLAQAWRDCERADWMMWLLGRTCKQGSAQHKKLVLLACRIASDALKRHWNRKDSRPRKAIRITRLWVRGRATIEQVKVATCDAAAVNAAHATYATYAAVNAVHAAHAVYAAAYVAAYAANVGGVGSGVGTYAAYADATRDKALKRYADWVRKDFPNPPRLK